MERKRRTLLATCRVCLRFGREIKKCKSLFKPYNSSTISDNIHLIADVKIDEGDGLPSKICLECLAELDAAIAFKEKCERSNKVLHSGESLFHHLKNKEPVSPIIELPVPIELVKNEDSSEDDLQYEYIENYDNAGESDSESKQIYSSEIKPESESEIKQEFDTKIKEEVDETDTVASEIKPAPFIASSEHSIAASKSQQLAVNKSKAIDLKLECHDCGGSFKSKCKLRVHWKKVHMLENIICNFCKKTFKSFLTLNKHLKNRPENCIFASQNIIEGTGRSRVFHCKICNFQVKKSGSLKTHMVKHTGERSFVCDLCSKSFAHMCSLQGHRESVHKIISKEITCQYCGDLVQGRHRIRKHMMKHVWSPVQCDICKKSFKSKQNLKTHLTLHTGIKSLTCEKCGKAFYNINGLLTHKRLMHTGKIYYTCDICGFKVLNKYSMEKHKAKHSDSNVGCGVCGRFYPDAKELASHRRVHTIEKTVCLECNKAYSSVSVLRRHQRETHKHKKKIAKDKKNKLMPAHMKTLQK